MFGGGFRWDHGEDEAFTRHIREIHKLKDAFKPIANTLNNLMESTRDAAKVQLKVASYYQKGGGAANDQDLSVAMSQMGDLLERLESNFTQSVTETTEQLLYNQAYEFLHKELPHSKAAKDRFTNAKRNAKNRESALKKLQKKRDPNPIKLQEAEQAKVDADREHVKFRAELQLSLERFDIRKVTIREAMSQFIEQRIQYHHRSLEILNSARDKFSAHQGACAERAQARGPSPTFGLGNAAPGAGGGGPSPAAAGAGAPPPFGGSSSSPSSPSFGGSGGPPPFSAGGAGPPPGGPPRGSLNRSHTMASSSSSGSNGGGGYSSGHPSRPPAAPIGHSASGPRGIPLNQAQEALSPKHKHSESMGDFAAAGGASSSRSPPKPPAWLRATSLLNPNKGGGGRRGSGQAPSPDSPPLEPNKLAKAPDLTYNALMAAHKHMSVNHINAGGHSANSSWDSQAEGGDPQRNPRHSRASTYAGHGAMPSNGGAPGVGGPPPPPAFISSGGPPPPTAPAPMAAAPPPRPASAMGLPSPGLPRPARHERSGSFNPQVKRGSLAVGASNVADIYSAAHQQHQGARFRGDSDTSDDSSVYDSDE